VHRDDVRERAEDPKKGMSARQLLDLARAAQARGIDLDGSFPVVHVVPFRNRIKALEIPYVAAPGVPAEDEDPRP
jgi:hypothetical protein